MKKKLFSVIFVLFFSLFLPTQLNAQVDCTYAGGDCFPNGCNVSVYCQLHCPLCNDNTFACDWDGSRNPPICGVGITNCIDPCDVPDSTVCGGFTNQNACEGGYDPDDPNYQCECPTDESITFSPFSADCAANQVTFVGHNLTPNTSYRFVIECDGGMTCFNTDSVTVADFVAVSQQESRSVTFDIEDSSGSCGSGTYVAGEGHYEVKITNVLNGNTYESPSILVLNRFGGGTTPPITTITPIATIAATCTTNLGDVGINTAIGCIPVNNTNDLSAFFLQWAMSIGGGLALLIAIYGGVIIKFSAGDPAKKQLGSQITTAAFTGLIMLVFAAYILELLGVQILRLPGL